MLIRVPKKYLWLFWGRREEYPEYVTASHKLWWRWLKETLL